MYNLTSYGAGFLDPTIIPSAGGFAVCIEGDIPVTASAQNFRLNYTEPANQLGVTNTILEFLQTNATLPETVLGAAVNISGTYSINSKLCLPSTRAANSTTIQILTHGVAFDKSYWDFYSSNYSYVDAAALAGYTTFSYDRLGTGKSAHPDPIQVVQTPLEKEILHELIQMLRAGGIGATAFENVVGVGHSFGSGLTVSNTVDYPEDLDAAVLTGFSIDLSGQPIFVAGIGLDIAANNNPTRFGSLPNGYMISSTVSNNQFGFFRAPNFDPLALWAAEATKQTFALGELFTNSLLGGIATKFTGPVDVVNGENDVPSCNGNCLVPTNAAAALIQAVYPAASNSSQYYTAPGTGHGLNLHFTAPAAYQHILHFLAANNL
ncbi:hypothetical protein BP6252_12897 [Coleophoma cylindrospora]|uniref:AB hydrolase-1 domain-containing protein n=1 Tax=Coleophoma cylindrospora TaxID=1849047 RepID=A0A3D8QDR9_9HELO|nr:hypothetical protein BP6252_12897 [Coleophoma cylindrospora]